MGAPSPAARGRSAAGRRRVGATPHLRSSVPATIVVRVSPRFALALMVLACSRRAPAPPVADAGAPDPLAGVIDPWSWPRAQGATARQRAIEDLGPWEPIDPRDPRSPPVNVNGHHWTKLAGLAWDRDVVIDLDREPVDLDGDGAPDTHVTRKIVARGGILGNPALFGLEPTPEDPRGTIGRVSASTGVLGLREAIDRDGRRTGLIGMTCWLCHGGRNPVDGQLVPGLAGTRFDYGLLLATGSVLDDDRRRALGFPTGNAARARLLTAGPGRQDLTGEFGLDLGVPGLHSARYPGVSHLRQGHRGVCNPLSVPPLFRPGGLSLQNWSGSESSTDPWLERLVAQVGEPLAAVRAAFGLPDGDPALARRALLLDLRNLGTLGLQQDSFPGLLWSEALRERVNLPAAALRAIPPLYAAREVRALAEAADQLTRPPLDRAQVARGQTIFSERVVGTIANRQLLKTVPAPYRPARLAAPVLAPIDPSRPLGALVPVRCADCHLAAPLETRGPITAPPLGRCSHCHWGHPTDGADDAAAARASTASAEVTACRGCHDQHRAFGPVAYSSGLLLPFDSDGDGNAQDDEADDQRAGGIGTEALLSFDVPRAQRPFTVDLPVIGDARHAGPVTTRPSGVAWVRVAPLIGVFATAPYLHNGSVPTLRALLEPAARRPVSFPLGQGGFVLDTRVAGNRNLGHEFGTGLTAREKDDLVAFLKSL
jgi:hypothetical protein